MPITSGDMQYNEATGKWEPIGGLQIAPYVPAGDIHTTDARRTMRTELERQGLPIPAYLIDAETEPEHDQGAGGQHELHTTDPGEAPPVVSLGGTRHIIEGGDDVELAELAGGDVDEPAPIDRIAELERRPAHDTDRPPPRRGRHR